jgi:hypothetical protein
MLPPIIRRPGRARHPDPRRRERGVTMALVALSIVGIISMAALAIDIGTLYQAKAEAQRTADAAALTAARVISVSGVTGDPNNASNSWQPTCGGASSTATLAATAIAEPYYNFVGGLPAPTVTVNYGPGGKTPDCSTLLSSTPSFAVNPTVTVTVTSVTLPIFFAKIFSLIPGVNYSNTTVSATAAAEVFNPSGSSALATGLVSVQPRCVKPWMVANSDPLNPTGCTTGCLGFVDKITGAIVHTGMQSSSGSTGVIGETFNLIADCIASSPGICIPTAYPPPVNSAPATELPNVGYLPGLVSYAIPAPAAPSCATSGTGSSPYYQQAVAGCDQNTVYQCGLMNTIAPTPNQLDLSENPGGPYGDSAIAAQCLINESAPGLGNGQDTLVPPPTSSIPYQIQAGSANVYGVSTGNLVSSSNSIVSLPIFDQTQALGSGTNPSVTIIGFLQVFINSVDAAGSVNVTVLNVAGCGETATGTTPSITGTSPVPARLITPP